MPPTQSSAAPGKKTFVIKPFRSHTQMTSAQASVIWSNLSSAISEIHNKNASLLSFEELYRSAYNLVLNKHGELLYDGVTNVVQSHLMAIVNRLLTSDSGAKGSGDLLFKVSQAWSEHQITMVMIRDILMYMDRTFVQQHKRKPVYALGLTLFRQTIWNDVSIRPVLSAVLLNNVLRERGGELIERGLMKSALEMLIEIGQGDNEAVYSQDFERPFLLATEEFYRAESMDYISKNSSIDYIKKALQRLKEEKSRTVHYLASSTEQGLMGIVERCVIEEHAKALVEMEKSGVVCLLEDNKVGELRAMYDLFCRVPSTVEIFRTAVCDHVKKTGLSLIADQSRIREPVVFVRGVLAMRTKYDNIVEQSFRGEGVAGKKVKEAFESFINSDSRAAQFTAVYIDELMRSGLKGMTEAETDSQLDKVVTIFRYLQDKDVFEEFYKSHLAKRLLFGKSISDEVEKSMVAKLKAECGYQFTSKLEGMFNDMRTSKDTMDAYKKATRGDESATSTSETTKMNTTEAASEAQRLVEMNVDVLTTGNWPPQNVPPCHLPGQIQAAITRFSDFYLKKHTGRKLAWQTSSGTAEIRATFDEGRKHDLIVSTYQMCILMLFNSNTSASRTLIEIRSATNIPDGELRRHLISLCTPKHRILKKASKGKLVEDDDSFTFNGAFTSKLKRVKVPLVSMKDSGIEGSAADGGLNGSDSAVPKAVEENRRHLLEAAIVRIMKTRKTLQHNDLIAEVSRQLNGRFVPDPQSAKKRIESLIEREYLERTPADRKTYSYLA